MSTAQPYLVFNELVDGQPASEPTVIHAGLVREIFASAVTPGVAQVFLIPEFGGHYVISCKEMPDPRVMEEALGAELPLGQAVPLSIKPEGKGCTINYADEESPELVEQNVSTSVKVDGLRTLGHKIIRVAPYVHKPAGV